MIDISLTANILRGTPIDQIALGNGLPTEEVENARQSLNQVFQEPPVLDGSPFVYS